MSSNEVGSNEVILSGVAHAFTGLRFTPAGVPVAEFSLRHSSVQHEAGGTRRVELDMPAVAFGSLARQLTADLPHAEITARGFLAARSRRSTQVVLHTAEIEYLSR